MANSLNRWCPLEAFIGAIPLAPISFFYILKVCHVFWKKHQVQGELQGLKIGTLGPSISHLQFVDDSIFFAQNDQRSVDALQCTLALFCDGSGQK
jgi:hypothetical protein